MSGCWRVDHLHATAPHPPCPDGCELTTWHATEDDALARAHRLRFAGCAFVVAWDAGVAV